MVTGITFVSPNPPYRARHQSAEQPDFQAKDGGRHHKDCDNDEFQLFRT
jgi:hypothetical protein